MYAVREYTNLKVHDFEVYGAKKEHIGCLLGGPTVITTKLYIYSEPAKFAVQKYANSKVRQCLI